MKLLEVKAIVKTYAKNKVVDGVSFYVKKFYNAVQIVSP